MVQWLHGLLAWSTFGFDWIIDLVSFTSSLLCVLKCMLLLFIFIFFQFFSRVSLQELENTISTIKHDNTTYRFMQYFVAELFICKILFLLLCIVHFPSCALLSNFLSIVILSWSHEFKVITHFCFGLCYCFVTHSDRLPLLLSFPIRNKHLQFRHTPNLFWSLL